MYANVSLMSSVLLVQFITEIFGGFHLVHMPLCKTTNYVCHISCSCFVWVCVRESRSSLYTSVLSLSAHPPEKLALITAVCLSH